MSHVISLEDSLVRRGRIAHGESKFRLLRSRQGAFVVVRFWCVVRRVIDLGRDLYCGRWSVGEDVFSVLLLWNPPTSCPKSSNSKRVGF